MRATGALPDDPSFHLVSFNEYSLNECVAAYLSDHLLLTTSLLPHGIGVYTNPRLKMLTSLDHTLVHVNIIDF
jgi:acyl-CoA thioesterase